MSYEIICNRNKSGDLCEPAREDNYKKSLFLGFEVWEGGKFKAEFKTLTAAINHTILKENLLIHLGLNK